MSEAFKETHETSWKERNPTGKDIVQRLIDHYSVEARYNKAVQHLKEGGLLEGSLRDIGLLIREVPEDIMKEETDNIKDILFKHFWPQIRRGVSHGIPEFYKLKLAESAFTDEQKSEQGEA